MNRLKTLLFATLFASLVPATTAQFYSFGGQLSRISGGPMIRNFGLHGTAEYMIEEKTGILGSIGYFLPHTTNSTLTLNARNSMATPRYIDVNSKDRTSGFQIALIGKRYFANEYDGEGFGFYGLFGLGFSSFSVNSKLDDYDESTYGAFERSMYEHSNGSGMTFSLGLGFDVQMESGSIYFEPMLNIPGNSTADGEAIAVEIPTTLQFNLGYRFLL